MKSLRPAILFFLLIPSLLHGQGEHSPENLFRVGFKRFALPSAVIHYNISGSRCGHETAYFDHHGWRETRESQFIIIPQSATYTRTQLNMLLGLIKYDIDLEKMEGTQMADTRLLSHFQNGKVKELYTLDSLSLIQMGANFKGTETVLGRNCLVFHLKLLGTTFWIWQGLTLRMAVDIQGEKYVSEAIWMEEDARIDPEKFIVPPVVRLKYK